MKNSIKICYSVVFLTLLLACNSENSNGVETETVGDLQTKKDTIIQAVDAVVNEIKSAETATEQSAAEEESVETKAQLKAKPATKEKSFKPLNNSKEKMSKVKISTSYGDMVAVLYNETPQHRDNFIKLTQEGFYSDLLFHRVIKNFMIQGGDPESKGAAPEKRLGSGGPGYTIEAEILPNYYHKKGALSAARQGDAVNPEKRSSGSQFYIVQGNKIPLGMSPQKENQLIQEYLSGPEGQEYQKKMNALRELAQSDPTKVAEAQKEFQSIIETIKEKVRENYTEEGPSQKDKDYAEMGGTPHLDGAYTVFGQVIEGLEVIDKIAAVQTAPGDRPVEDVKMTISLLD